MKKDSLLLGIVLGTLLPVGGLLSYYVFKFAKYLTLVEFFQLLYSQKSLISGIISLCLVVNAAAFTYFMNVKIDKTGRGIFIATAVYATIAIAFKFFL
ncbi:MAG: hypothetical protein EAZ47_00715 [Bacteroidetes bacterium]|nr:MAG: hypothetical protein EAY72_12385 [Bacteroidota bacterium]TAE66429.1 MAG: hypothetical protein EAY68_06195 [Bacteroidota bacterium]TAF98279.1 MAG: hypothetical protein EAZ47_00715 [Bacteroidota bacterium]